MGDARLLDRDEYLKRLVAALAAKTERVEKLEGLLTRFSNLHNDWDSQIFMGLCSEARTLLAGEESKDGNK